MARLPPPSRSDLSSVRPTSCACAHGGGRVLGAFLSGMSFLPRAKHAGLSGETGLGTRNNESGFSPCGRGGATRQRCAVRGSRASARERRPFSGADAPQPLIRPSATFSHKGRSQKVWANDCVAPREVFSATIQNLSRKLGSDAHPGVVNGFSR